MPQGARGGSEGLLCDPPTAPEAPKVAQTLQSRDGRDGCSPTLARIPPTCGPRPAPARVAPRSPLRTHSPLPTHPLPRGRCQALLPPGQCTPWSPKAGGMKAIAAPCAPRALQGSRCRCGQLGRGTPTPGDLRPPLPGTSQSLRVPLRSPSWGNMLPDLVPLQSRAPAAGAMDGGMPVTGSPGCCPKPGSGGAEQGQEAPSQPPGPEGPHSSGDADQP